MPFPVKVLFGWSYFHAHGRRCTHTAHAAIELLVAGAQGRGLEGTNDAGSILLGVIDVSGVDFFYLGGGSEAIFVLL
jgi:hypothetical protein